MKPLFKASRLSWPGLLLLLSVALCMLVTLFIYEFDVDGPLNSMGLDSCENFCDQADCLLLPVYDW